jgi:hypothetical protein
MDLDLRQLNSLVRSAFAMALQNGDKVARIPTPDAPGRSRFNLTAWTPQEPSC